MSDFYTCKCGEVLDDHCPHTCPGTPEERIAALETEVARLKKFGAILFRASQLTTKERDACIAEWLGGVMGADCSHQKVYSGERFLTLIPQWHWICADCRAMGADSIPSETPPPLDLPRFLDLLANIDPEGAESVRRTLAKVAERRALRAWEASG